MRTPDDIKKGLEDTIIIYKSPCSNFVSEALQKVTANIAKEALAHIQQLEKKCNQLEKERDALAALYKPHSTCESCKHNFKESGLCDDCTTKNNYWEWRGVKEADNV